VAYASGADQLWIFDNKYYLIQIGALGIAAPLLLRLTRSCGVLRTLMGIPLQLTMLSAMVLVTVPTMVRFPGFGHSVVFIAERMSLAVAVCVCVLLASTLPRRGELYRLAALTAAFFTMLFLDERALNRYEDKMASAVGELPPGARVVSAIDDPAIALRSNALAHAIDRACIGRCFSYANYEPSTADFRVRAVAPNPFVVTDHAESLAIQLGQYRVKESDPPIYQVAAAPGGNLVVERRKAGSICGSTSVHIIASSSRGKAYSSRSFWSWDFS
jgi:hypothetical protein